MARPDDHPTIVSYVAAAVGGLLVVLLLAYLAWGALTPDPPASLRATVVEGEPRREAGVAYVPVDVANDGGEAVAQVVVEVAADGSTAGIETVVDYLAGGESRRIVALVAAAPEGAFRARVVSYQEP